MPSHFGHAAGDVGVGGEVGVDLDAEREDARPEHVELRRLKREHLVGDDADAVGDDELLEEAPREEQRGVAGGRRREPASRSICGSSVAGAHDGAGHQVGKNETNAATSTRLVRAGARRQYTSMV